MTDRDEAADRRPRPSQAEGSEDDEKDLDERLRPSQAEGDLDTIDEDLEEEE